MATQNQPQKRTKPDTIECPNCHERYSTTYNRCPFCKEQSRSASRKAGGSKETEGTRPRGGQSSTDSRGRRVARTTRGGGYGKPAYFNQIIFFVVTFALIIAACFVVGKTVGPLLNRNPSEKDDPSISTSPDDTNTPDDTTTDPFVPEVVDPEPTSSLVSISLNYSDVTLRGGETLTITPTLNPADAKDTIVWTSSNDSALTVSLGGIVTNTNTSSSTEAVTVTATVGDISAQCIVRCKPTAGGSSSSTSTAIPDGANAVVTGASSGLNIRSGPSTSDEVIASLTNGNKVTILSTPSASWYKINFYDTDGTLQTGYASSSFIRAD